VLVTGTLLIAFGMTLFAPPNMIFRFATLQDKTIKGSLAEKRVERYCRKVTIVWCVFFVLNGAMAAYTVFFSSDRFWSIYNGGISYILIGIVFAGEFIVRKITDKKMPKAFSLSQFTAASRPAQTVLCYEDVWSAGRYKTWQDFLDDTARLRRVIEAGGSSRWILHAEDCWYFLTALTALLQCQKIVLLTANVSPAYIAEIRTEGTAFFTDQVFNPAEGALAGTLHIGDILKNESPAAADIPLPAINAGETVIMMYTSGTTGRPKVVQQRLTEFEQDNRFILSRWGEEFLKRKLCSTVSQHHIYGILFSILLPFTAGVPFRRSRIEYPEEFEKLTDESYMIITVPAFLKRAVEVKEKDAYPLRRAPPMRAPWIFTSGGVLTPDIAEKTNTAFGFWPLEVYGRTETSGIAWRQSKNGLEWTPFDNAEISKTADGCLLIRSPYIKDPAGFATGDLVDILDDGRFLLKGRADSIVKIEEKRISLPEVEMRIMQSGLVADVCVVAMDDRRQYLAAALVLNKAGAGQFNGLEKYEINRYFSEYLLQFFENIVLPKKWRYLDALPVDVQGKKKKLEIQALFASTRQHEDSTADILAKHSITNEKVLEQSDERTLLEIYIPPESDYFDGHFPLLQVLPAVAQFEIVLRLAHKYFKSGISVTRLKRIKFSGLIRPGTLLHMELKYNAAACSMGFVLASPDGETTYSSGTITLGAAL
jgi:acyl-coenzyme A synthetase/AMP-(fatty) acid ligase